MIFPPAFLDSSSWNDNQQQQQQGHHHQQVANGGGEGNHHELLGQASIMGGAGAGAGALPEGGGQVGPGAKPMSMSERARLARIPLPEPGLKCPRCDSTNTKFCYFNNYSLSQPRHFCRACRRYWTRGGALRNVPVGGGYRRHAKRAKPKQSSGAAGAAANGTTTAAATALAPSSGGGTSSACATTANAPAAHHLSGQAAAMLAAGGNLSMLPPLLRLADFDAMSLGGSFNTGMGKPPSLDNYSIGGGNAGMEQWSRVQQQMQQGFPFLHAMDHQGALPPSLAMVMPGAFQLGLDTADGRGGAGTGGEDSSGDQLNGMPTKREAAATGGYPPRGMYAGDHHHHHLTAAGYTTSYSNATGNHLL